MTKAEKIDLTEDYDSSSGEVLVICASKQKFDNFVKWHQAQLLPEARSYFTYHIVKRTQDLHGFRRPMITFVGSWYQLAEATKITVEARRMLSDQKKGMLL